MSSLAATQADGYYYPPDWAPKRGGKNKFQGSHPLGKRAAKISEGIVVIRFELPYSAWCLGCDAHIGKGVRFNAEKSSVGKYFTTTIFEFRMKCHLCNNEFVIRTDPKNRDYEFVSGIKPKAVAQESSEGVAELTSAPEAMKLSEDPMFALEHEDADKRKAQAEQQRIIDLQSLSDARYKSDVASNKMLRRKSKLRRDEVKQLRSESDKKGLAIDLCRISSEDTAKAAEMFEEQQRKKRRDRLLSVKRPRVPCKLSKAAMFEKSQADAKVGIQEALKRLKKKRRIQQ